MSSELAILALYALLIFVVILVQVLIATPKVGLSTLAGPRDDMGEPPVLVGRAQRTIDNCVTGMATFAPAILILAAQGAFTATTLLLAQVFLIARVIYAVVYLAGIPWVRTLAWLTAFAANAWLLLLCL